MLSLVFVVLQPATIGGLISVVALDEREKTQNVVGGFRDWYQWIVGMVRVGQDMRLEHAYIHLLDSSHVSRR